MNRTRIARSLALFALLGATAAHANFVQPQSWSRGVGGTTYQEWDNFTGVGFPFAIPTPNQAPDVASINPNGTAGLTEVGLNSGAFVTGSGSGNIYSFSGATAFEVTIPEADVPTPPHNVTAIVQIETLGTEYDPASLLLNGLAPVSTVELSRAGSGASFGGDAVVTWNLFEVPYASFGDGIPGTEDLLLEFSAAESSMSLAALAIDTAIRPFGFFAEPDPVVIPEPSALLLSVGLVGLVAARRR